MIIAGPVMGEAQADGFFTLTGDEAAGYTVPSDTTLIRSMRMDRFGLTYERYQQAHEGAKVLGGQVTIHRDDDGNIVRVIGAHYPDIVATNTVRITAAGARGLVDRDIGPDGERGVSLMIDPESGRFFWRVETRRATSRWVHWIGADSGATLNKFDALANQACVTGDGYGMAYDRDFTTYMDDRKILDCLITPSGSGTRMVTESDRQETHDQGSSRRPFLGPIATHDDDLWDISGRESPGTGALVDAHYYVAQADAYFLSQYGFDFIANHNGPIVVHGHYTKNYVNAFWNGSYIAFGDGDGVSYDPLTSMDVAAHEFTHSVTEYTSDLIYQDASGALNESFSDIMAAVIERLSDTGVLTPEPDGDLALPGTEWLVGEDFDLRPGENGFRNMADPAEDGDPAHYDDRYTGTGDNGGVHINSGISNHAFYRLVDIHLVPIQRAADIFYLGYTGLPSDADFCAARDATIAMAGAEAPEVTTAWNEVGVDAALCDGVVVDDPPNAGLSAICINLACDFKDESMDDGNIVSRLWTFGDGFTSTEQNPSHTYDAAGTYNVSLTVTDDASPAQQDTANSSVTVSDGSGSNIGLTAQTFKVRGVRWATLTWTNVGSVNVDIYLDGTIKDEDVPTSASPYDFLVGGRGGGSFDVLVCEADTTNNCSDIVTLTY